MTDVVPETPPPANRGLWMLVIGLGIAILLVVAIMVGMAIRRVWMPKKPEAQTTTEVAEPTRPPYGVDIRLWQRTCELADELADALVDGDEPDHDAAVAVAAELHDLLRPYI